MFESEKKLKNRKKFILILLIIDQIKVQTFILIFYWHIKGAVWLRIHLIFGLYVKMTCINEESVKTF